MSADLSALDHTWMVQAIQYARLPLCITDPTLPDNPIVYANHAFSELTGYETHEVIGRNCRFLQGAATTRASIARIKDIMAGQTVDTVDLVNYRKDGSEFLNTLQIGPILDEHGKIIYYFGSQLDTTERNRAESEARRLADAELMHRLRNIVNVMNVIIRMSAREETDVAALVQMLTGRLTALSTAHFDTIDSPVDRTTSLSGIAGSILEAYAPMGTRQFSLDGAEIALPAELISPVTLVIHELATNCVKYGAFSAAEGVVDLRWRASEIADGTLLTIRWTERDGPAVAPSGRKSGSGIIEKLVASIGGRLAFDWQPGGLVVDAEFPIRD